jgi:hypothetical protein
MLSPEPLALEVPVEAHRERRAFGLGEKPGRYTKRNRFTYFPKCGEVHLAHRGLLKESEPRGAFPDPALSFLALAPPPLPTQSGVKYENGTISCNLLGAS